MFKKPLFDCGILFCMFALCMNGRVAFMNVFVNASICAYLTNVKYNSSVSKPASGEGKMQTGSDISGNNQHV